MRYQLIIFDWDGTLMDSERKIVRCFQAAADDVGIPRPRAEEVHNIIGLGLQEAFLALYTEQPADLIAAAVERYRQHFLHLDQTDMSLFPGVAQGLAEFRGRGIKLAVATGKARRGLDRVLRETQTGHLFAATRCSDEAISKPHPKMILDLLEMTQVPAHSALMVGDTDFDMEMASRAGVDRVAVTYGVHDRDRLLAHRPLACMNSFATLREWLLSNVFMEPTESSIGLA